MPEIVNGFDLSIRDEMVSQVGPAGIDIAYQRLGKSDAPAVLLIMGIGADALWDGHTRAEAAASVLANGPHIYDLSR